MQVSQEVDMELSLSKAISDWEVRNRSDRHLAWLIVFLLLLALAFELLSWGVTVTVWKLDRQPAA